MSKNLPVPIGSPIFVLPAVLDSIGTLVDSFGKYYTECKKLDVQIAQIGAQKEVMLAQLKNKRLELELSHAQNMKKLEAEGRRLEAKISGVSKSAEALRASAMQAQKEASRLFELSRTAPSKGERDRFFSNANLLLDKSSEWLEKAANMTSLL